MKDTIYFNPVTAIYENMAPGTIICGSPGSGKTYFMQTLATNALQIDCNVIMLDPKNDHVKLCEVEGTDFRVVDLAKKQSLDPFLCVKNCDANFIMSVIESICNGIDKNTIVAVQPIVQDFCVKAKYGNATFSKMTDYLYGSQNELARQVGTMLKSNQESEWGPVIFNGSGKTMKMGRENMIISMFGLPLPKTANKENWSKEECFASTIAMIIIKMLRETLTQVNDRPVCLFIDEAHIILSNPAIYKIVEEFLILGRSLNVVTILGSQNVTHFPDNFSNFVTSRFQLRSSKSECLEFLNRFLAEDTEDIDYLVQRCMSANNGECIYIDRKNRVGIIQISGDLGITTNAIQNNNKEKEKKKNG